MTVPALRRRVVNVLSNWGGSFVAIVTAFFLSPFVVAKLGDSTYGVWSLMSSLTGYLGLLDFGTRQAVTRYIAKCTAEADSRESSRIVSSAFTLYLCSGVLAVAVAAIVGFAAIGRFEIPVTQQPTARLVLLICGCTVAVSLIGGVFGGTLAGLQRFDRVNLTDGIATCVRAALCVIVLSAGYGLVELALVQLSVTLAVTLVNAAFVRRLAPDIQIRFRDVDHARLRLILSFGAAASLLHISSYIITYTDSVVIASVLPVSEVTFFAIAANLIAYSRHAVGGIAMTVTPLASQVATTGGQLALQRVVLDSARYASAVMMPVLVTLLVRGATFIGLWMGPQYAGPAGAVLQVLSVAGLFTSAVAASWAVMFGIDRHRGVIPASVLEALSNLGLSLILIRRMGILGVAVGTALPSLSVSLTFWPWYVRRTTGVPIRVYARNAWLRPLISAVPFMLLSVAVERWWTPSGLLVFFVQVGLTLPVAIVPAWYLCVPSADRSRFLRAGSERLAPGVRRMLGVWS